MDTLPDHMRPERSFQGFILALQRFWAEQGCVILQPYDMEMGAGTFHPATTLRALGPKRWNAAYVQPSRRPKDGRYGENPNRLQHYYQFQVIMKPSPPNLQDLYLKSLAAIGIDSAVHDIRFVEDDWESPTLGAWGLGWECWCDGMEVSQFTYFQQVAGVECAPVAGELTYGLERLAMYVQGVDRVYDLNFNGREGADKVSYGDVFLQAEQEHIAIADLVGALAAVEVEVVDAVDALHIHRKPLEPVGELARDRRAFDAGDLLEIGELRHFHAVAPAFPPEPPRAERRALPVVLDKTDVVQLRIDADRL